MDNSDDVELTVELKDGRTFSGTYHYLAALARIDYAKQHPLYKDFTLRKPR